MANIYAANFGDVVKHCVLAEALTRERPTRYLESHAGRFDYALSDLDPGPGGVWDFVEASAGQADLGSSTYARAILDLVGQPGRPGRYPGSIALADALLPPGVEIVAYELVSSSAANLVDRLTRHNRPARVIVADGLSGVCEAARPGDLVLLDPFHVQARGERFTAVEAFEELASRGVGTMLWYAVYEPDEPAAWTADAARGLEDVWHARLVGDSTAGGLAGCGFLTAHLSPATVSAAAAAAMLLIGALSAVRPGLRLE